MLEEELQQRYQDWQKKRAQQKNSSAAIHKWVRKNKPYPEKCQLCQYRVRVLFWANIRNHQYRRVLADYVALCGSCHIKFDRFGEAREKVLALST